MIDPVDGKVIRPYADHMWARSVDNEVKLIRITDYTRAFLEMIESLHETAGLKLTDIQLHSVQPPELFFEGGKPWGCAMIFCKDNCWNIQTGLFYLNNKAVKEAVTPFLEFLDKDAGRVDYEMVKEYLGLKDEEKE